MSVWVTKLEWSFCNYVTTIISSVVILDQRCSYYKLSASARSGFKVGSIGMAWFELLASFAKLNTKVCTTRQRQINYEKKIDSQVKLFSHKRGQSQDGFARAILDPAVQQRMLYLSTLIVTTVMSWLGRQRPIKAMSIDETKMAPSVYNNIEILSQWSKAEWVESKQTDPSEVDIRQLISKWTSIKATLLKLLCSRGLWLCQRGLNCLSCRYPLGTNLTFRSRSLVVWVWP